MIYTPDKFPVSVIMESKPSKSPWLDQCWSAIGVCCIADESKDVGVEKVIQQGEIQQFVYRNLKLRLYVDECESYYHNLLSPHPSCYVIAREDGQGKPIPVIVSMSFDEANAYQEGDDLVYSVPIPVELYRWLEAYVIEHYMPQKRKKRKRVQWNDTQ